MWNIMQKAHNQNAHQSLYQICYQSKCFSSPHITLSHCMGIWAIWLGVPHTCSRHTGPSQEVALLHTAPHWSHRSCPPSYWSAGDKVGPIHQCMACALRCTYRCPAAPFYGQSCALWWQRPVNKIGSSHHQLFTWCAVVDFQELPYIVVLYAGYSVFHLYTLAWPHTLVIVQWKVLEFWTLLYSHYLDTQCGAHFAHGAELTRGLGSHTLVTSLIWLGDFGRGCWDW